MMITYKKRIIHMMLAAVISLFAVTSARTMADGMQNATIQATNGGCNPSVLQVQPWTTVTWVNTGSVPVSIVSDNYFGSPISPGFTYIFTFSTPGQYRYSCTPLGTQITSGSSMSNVIQVVGPGFNPGVIGGGQIPNQPVTPAYNQPPVYTPTYASYTPPSTHVPTPTYGSVYNPPYNPNPAYYGPPIVDGTPSYSPPYTTAPNYNNYNNYNSYSNGYQNPPTYTNSQSNRYTTGTVVNDHGTLYLIINNYKVMFTDWNTYTQLGYGNHPVVYGDTSQYQEWPNYRIGNPYQAHSWSTWLMDRNSGTVYYSCSQGMIPVPSWDVFTRNGGQQWMLMPMNQADYGRLYNNPPVPPMTYNDTRMY